MSPAIISFLMFISLFLPYQFIEQTVINFGDDLRE